MTDYAELCERLRARVPGWAMDRAVNPDGREAVVAIERLSAENEALREALAMLDGDRETQPLHPTRLDRILDFEERVGQLAGPNDSATLSWADQRALIAEAVLSFRARTTLKGADHD